MASSGRFTQDAEPVSRVRLIDALRAFALFGIVVVNTTFFASAYSGAGMNDPAFAATVDDIVRWTIATVFESKF